MLDSLNPTGEGTRSARAPSIARAVLAILGMAALLGANYYLRHTLERGDVYIYSFFPYFYPDAEKLIFAPSYPWSKLFLPIPELAGAWTTTTLIATHFIEMRLTPPVTWYVFNAALMVVSFLTSWAVFRSLVFSFTFVICMGFGTQLYATYAVTGSMGLCLLLIYYELVLLCAIRLLQGAAPRTAWKLAFVAIVLVMALAYESWLDFAVFLWLAGALTAAVAYRFGKREWWPGLLFAGGWLGLVCAAYLYIKMNLGYGQIVGAESDVVFNYPTLAPKVEDVMSNVLRQFYVVITNFLPPVFMSSTAFYSLGGDKLVELQHGYHAPYSYLVVMQYLFLWRYYAGAAFVLFSYGLIRTLRRCLAVWSPEAFTVAILLLMIATGGPTHAFVKARPMHSMPLLGYHVIVGVLGVALLLSYFARFAVIHWRRRGLGMMIIAAIWATVFFSALSRPAMLGHQAAQVGLGVGIYPDPWMTLLKIFGRSTAPAGGADGYRLTKFIPSPPPAATPLASSGGKLEPLPTTVSNWREWTTFAGVTATPSERGYRVVGNSSDGGYQLSSPPIPVPANHRLLVRVQGTMEKGRACLGILSQSQQWLLAPAPDRGELSVDTGDNRVVTLVFINCGLASGAEEPSIFEIESVSYAFLLNGRSQAPPRQ